MIFDKKIWDSPTPDMHFYAVVQWSNRKINGLTGRSIGSDSLLFCITKKELMVQQELIGEGAHNRLKEYQFMKWLVVIPAALKPALVRSKLGAESRFLKELMDTSCNL